VDAAADLAARVLASRVAVVWGHATARVEKAAELEGEHEARRLVKPLGASDFTAMRQAYEARWWALEDRQVPSRSYMEKRLEAVEADEPRAEPLSEVASREDEDPEVLLPVWDASGNLKIKRGSATLPMPANPETLRRRMGIWGVSWMFAAVRHTNRAWLEGITPQLFNDYLDYLLGDYVWGLVAKDGAGRTLAAPGWHQLLDYEHAIRKEMCRKVAAGKGTLATCLREAWRDPVVKDRFPLTLLLFRVVRTAEGAGTGTPPLVGQERP
jgi:hypothetical protein